MSITGIVKWYDKEKGYGFISANNGNDVFVHKSQIKEKSGEKDLKEGQSVTLDVIEKEKGLAAINVQKL